VAAALPTTTSALTRVEDLMPLQDDLVAMRHHLHRHPELAFAEHETSDYSDSHFPLLSGSAAF